MEPLIFAIIANYNNYDDLLETIECFKNQHYSNLRIVVVDNGSDEKYRSRINAIEGIILLQNEENLGWAAANNRGVKHAIGNGAEYVILANNDVCFDNKMLVANLVFSFRNLKSEINCRILAPSIYNYSNRNKLQSNGDIVLKKYERIGLVFNKYRKKIAIDEQQIETVRISDFVYGCFLMADIQLFKDAGMFDEKMFMYHEEIDYCYRAWQNNYCTCALKSEKVFHKDSLTSVKYSPFFWYYFTRNYFYLMRKHKKGLCFHIILVYHYFKDLLRIVIYKNRRVASRRKTVKALLLGMFHGISNNMNYTFKK